MNVFMRRGQVPRAVVPYRKLGDDFTHFIIVDFHRGIFRAGQREEIGM